jgi:hypothetical protein
MMAPDPNYLVGKTCSSSSDAPTNDTVIGIIGDLNISKPFLTDIEPFEEKVCTPVPSEGDTSPGMTFFQNSEIYRNVGDEKFVEKAYGASLEAQACLEVRQSQGRLSHTELFGLSEDMEDCGLLYTCSSDFHNFLEFLQRRYVRSTR